MMCDYSWQYVWDPHQCSVHISSNEGIASLAPALILIMWVHKCGLEREDHSIVSPEWDNSLKWAWASPTLGSWLWSLFGLRVCPFLCLSVCVIHSDSFSNSSLTRDFNFSVDLHCMYMQQGVMDDREERHTRRQQQERAHKTTETPQQCEFTWVHAEKEIGSDMKPWQWMPLPPGSNGEARRDSESSEQRVVVPRQPCSYDRRNCCSWWRRISHHQLLKSPHSSIHPSSVTIKIVLYIPSPKANYTTGTTSNQPTILHH